MNKMDLRDVEKGDVVTFRCGGKVVVQYVKEVEDGLYPLQLQITGLHVVDDPGWDYAIDGSHGDATGPIDQAPFDIVMVRKPSRREVKFELRPKG